MVAVPVTETAAMSVTHPTEAVRLGHKPLLQGHDQLGPFLLAVAIAVATVLVSLAFTGLPQ
jgi:hypothetical protein